MADSTIGMLPATEAPIGDLPSIADLYDDSLLAVEQQGVAHKMTGKQWKGYAQAGVTQYVESAKEAAENASKSAEEAAGSAEQGAKSAEDAAKSADTARQYSGKPPMIQNGTWWTWNAEAQAYEDTGEAARGPIGPEGDAGSSIQSIDRTAGTGAPGTTDTYTVTLTDNSIGGTFQIYNGRDGTGLGTLITVTLSASGWTDNVQIANHDGLLANGYSYFVDAPAGITADDVTVDGQMTFRCAEVPAGDVTVNILRIEVNSNG